MTADAVIEGPHPPSGIRRVPSEHGCLCSGRSGVMVGGPLLGLSPTHELLHTTRGRPLRCRSTFRLGATRDDSICLQSGNSGVGRATYSHPASGCHGLEVALFAPVDKAFIVVTTEQRTPYLEVLSYAQTCGSGANAIRDFYGNRKGHLTSRATGIGDDARIASFNNAMRERPGLLANWSDPRLRTCARPSQ